MNHPDHSPSTRWTFTLVDELPGPSTGDAAEHLEGLGFNPWSFEELALIDEVTHDRMVVATFAVVGPATVLARLQAAHESALECHPRRRDPIEL